jgi:DNA-binding transcriptional MerR regulator
MKTVKQVSRLTGISVRALHHYDAIGLLKPSQVTGAGYRLYDDAALSRLQQIMLFRALEFPLGEIKEILDRPDYDPMAALQQQITLLELRRQHLDKLIDHARHIQEKGEFIMDFKAYDHAKLDEYARQAKKQWGNTDAYREFTEKTAGQPPEKTRADGDGLMEIFAQMGTIRHLDPDSAEAQALVGRLQSYITDHYYTCTKQILRGLGQMYIAGDSMTENIDAAGGKGTAQFAHDAIEIYCK